MRGTLAILAILAFPLVTDAAAPAQRAGAVSTLAVQVALDRAGFSTGEIDGRTGPSTRKALRAYEQARGPLDRERLPDPLARYTITSEDADGPFIEAVPDELMDQALLPGLHYTSPLEKIAEKFHASPALLKKLNPQARFETGDVIRVPDIEPMAWRDAAAPVDAEDVVVRVSSRERTLSVTGAGGQVILHAPVSAGSEHDPLPPGKWHVTGVSRHPAFHYNPDLFWDAKPQDDKATIKPGPNNPVGLVWIDIDRAHYGLHGTAEPSHVGRTESHGCVRLTNWDALRLARLVRAGTRIIFE